MKASISNSFLKSARLAVPAVLLAALAVVAPAQENFMPEAPAAGEEKPEEVKYSLILPNQKTSEQVKEGERNPFTKVNQDAQNLDAAGTTEENEIRDRLAKLRVVGVSPGVRGLRVMLGDMVLEPGEDVPQVLPEQTLSLRVGTISPRAIELVWVEKKPTGLPARTLTIPVDLRPYVRSILKGQANTVNQWEKEKPETARGVVATEFPEVAQTAAQAPSQLAQNDRAPVKSPAAPQGAPLPPTQPTAEPGKQPASEVPAIPPIPQLEEAMSFLKKLVPLSGSGEKN